MPPPLSSDSAPKPRIPCRHTVVRIVSRSDDAEFVECQACGDIFDSIEYEDMAREDALAESSEDDEATPRPAAPRKAAKSQPQRRR